MLNKSFILSVFLAFFITPNALAVKAIKADKANLTLSATSKIEYKPTNVTIDFVISSFASTPENSYDIYEKRSKSLITTLQAIPKIEEIYTKSFQLTPKYDYQERTKILQGYDTNGYFSLETDIQSVGIIINLLADNNVDSISNISFNLSPENLEEVKTQSANEAIKLALLKADNILSQLELNKYKIINISVEDYDIHANNYYQSGLLLTKMKSAEHAVLPGKQSLATTVILEVEFE